ncbi:unnamed protein product [Coffea canephora]|uniref:Protein TIFY 5A-like n=2 Tax=Coffea TaxID=13442 RepID=A0A068UE61_COFCA|nr:unnamed protein product [Coffea canephora]
MMRKCTLELPLSPASASSESTDFHSQSEACSSRRDQITVLHNMRSVCICDATELQAIIILWLARREVDDKLSSFTGAVPSIMKVQLHSSSGLSLRKSLQRFLQKRKDRIQSATPYKHKFL